MTNWHYVCQYKGHPNLSKCIHVLPLDSQWLSSRSQLIRMIPQTSCSSNTILIEPTICGSQSLITTLVIIFKVEWVIKKSIDGLWIVRYPSSSNFGSSFLRTLIFAPSVFIEFKYHFWIEIGQWIK